MPVYVTSSVDVVSTERAHRRHRSTSTDATGRLTASMLEDEVEVEDEAEDEALSFRDFDGLGLDGII
jgi:hypothetical protein